MTEATCPDTDLDSTPAGERVARVACWAIILGFFAVSIAVQFIVRLDWGPDEVDHIKYVHELAHGRIPTEEQTHQVQHGPLYYALLAGVWGAMGVDQDPALVPRDITGIYRMTPRAVLARRVLRACNALLGCAVLLVMMRIMATIGTPWSWRPWLLLTVAGNPVLQYLGGIVNNEIASILYSALICLFIVGLLKSGQCSLRHAAILGLLIGGTMLVKRTALFVVPAVLWVLWTRGPASERTRRLALFALCALLIGLWWPLLADAGGLLGSTTVPDDQPTLQNIMNEPLMPLLWLVGLFETSFLPLWYWEIILRLPIQIILGVILLAITAIAIWGLAVRRDRFHFELRALAVVSMLALVASIFHYCLTADWRAHMQGRYLLNALPWLVCLLAGMRPVIEGVSQRGRAIIARVKGSAKMLFAVAVIAFTSTWWYLAWLFYANIEKRF